ncbi:MAG: hypothetical protein PF447_14085, partial [Spirochaetaceae bacterium]|nr:hypothetical protein [Spirochaetaceae bacterium]
MAIWKNKQIRLLLMTKLGGRSKFLPVCILVGFLSLAPLSGDSSISVRSMPAYFIPINSPTFQSGPGGSVTVDYHFKPSAGLFFQGDYMSLPSSNINSSNMIDVSLGGELNWRIQDRFSLGTQLSLGLYNVDRSSDNSASVSSASGISAGIGASAEYHFSPAISFFVQGGFKYYASTPEPLMSAASVGLGIKINLTEGINKPSRIHLETLEQDPVFPVFYSWYDDNYFANISIQNNENNEIRDIKTSFYLEQFMTQPTLCETIDSLEAGETFQVSLRALFDESMLDLTEKVQAEATAIVEYSTLGATRKVEIPISLPVQHRNAMSWVDDRRAAAFVSSKDPAALWFAKYVSSVVRDHFRQGINKNIQYAMGMFEGINVFGLNYIIDPSSAYSEMSESTEVIDFLQFPYQTLMYRGGDCDDLSILFCSLLEAIGVETAFITIPGHIFMAFSLGMTEEEAKNNFYAPELLVYHNGMAWVPLETTLTQEGFSKAWRIGAKEWSDAHGRGEANIFPTHDSWKIYQPVSVPGAASRFRLPEEEKMALAFDHSLDIYVQKEIAPQIESYQEAILAQDTPRKRNELGALLGKYGMIDQARAEFQRGVDGQYKYSWINMGNLSFMEGKYQEALYWYQQSLLMEPKNALGLLGMSRSYYELENFAYTDYFYSQLLQVDSSLAREYGYLASFFETQGRAWSLSDRLSTTIWSVESDEIQPAALPAEPVALEVPEQELAGEPETIQPEPVALEVPEQQPAVEPEALPAEPVALEIPEQEPAGEPEAIPAEPVALEIPVQESTGEPEAAQAEPAVQEVPVEEPAPEPEPVQVAQAQPETLPAEPVALEIPEQESTGEPAALRQESTGEPEAQQAVPVVQDVPVEEPASEPEAPLAVQRQLTADPVESQVEDTTETSPTQTEGRAAPRSGGLSSMLSFQSVEIEEINVEELDIPQEQPMVEPVTSAEEPAAVAGRPEPVVVEPEPVVVEPEPVVVEPEPVVVEPEPVVVEPERVVVEPEPVVVETEPVVVETEPVVVETEPVVVETEPVVVEPEPVVVEPE